MSADEGDSTRQAWVKTRIDDIVEDAALNVGLDPERAEILSGKVDDDGCLSMRLEGPPAKCACGGDGRRA